MANKRCIGIIIPNTTGYIYDVVRGITQAIRPHRNITLRLAGAYDNWFQQILDWKPDGIIALVFDDNIAKHLLRMKVPLVSFSSGHLWPQFAYVNTDSYKVGIMAAEHLLSLKLKSFAYWAGHTGIAPYAIERRKGFFTTLQNNGVDENNIHTLSPSNIDDWRQRDRAISEWLIALPKPIGVFVTQDSHAYYLSDLAREAEIDIPNEIALIGVDNDSLLCELANPALSSIQQPGKQVGIRAAERLIELIDGGEYPGEAISFAPIGVIERGSTDMLAIDNPNIAKAVRYIRQHAIEGINVTDVLNLIPMARRAFEDQFREIFGRSPSAEISRVQLTHAKRMLLEGDAPMAEVADECGFCDAQYLARIFRRIVGMTPSQFRRQYHKP